MEDWHEVNQTTTLEPIKAQYEVMRIMIMRIHNMNPYRKEDIESPLDVMPLPWDKPRTPQKQSVDQMKRAIMAIARANKGIINKRE